MSSQQSNILRVVILNFINSYIIKKALNYFVKQDKHTQRTRNNILKYLLFAVLLLTFDYYFHSALTTRNLYLQAGASRYMTNAEIMTCIDQAKVDVMLHKGDNINQAIQQTTKLDEIGKILGHNARRLTYDTFGLMEGEYAWSFMSPNFIISILIGSSVFYVICLISNIMGKENKNINLKAEIILIIVAFIWETETLMHSEARLIPHPDLLDHLFQALPIFERRELLKYMIAPISMLIQNFNSLFIYSSAETRLKQLVEWVPPGYFLQIQDKLMGGKIRKDQHLQENVQVLLKELQEKKSKEGETVKERVQVFREQREMLRKFLLLESDGILKDLRLRQILDGYALPLM